MYAFCMYRKMKRKSSETMPYQFLLWLVSLDFELDWWENIYTPTFKANYNLFLYSFRQSHILVVFSAKAHSEGLLCLTKAVRAYQIALCTQLFMN